MSKPRSVQLSTGLEVALDGDLLAIIEALYREVTLSNVLSPSFETMRSEILSLTDQMSATERRTYLAESLFLNSVTYENEMLSAYARRLGAKVSRKTGAGRATPAKGSKKKPR
jgi:predicted DNA-binding helix-hairpin-helix protein